MADKKTTITKAERLQLVGLVTLGGRYSEQLNQVEEAMYSLVGLDPNEFITYDVISGDKTIEWFLERAGVTVEEN